MVTKSSVKFKVPWERPLKSGYLKLSAASARVRRAMMRKVNGFSNPFPLFLTSFTMVVIRLLV